MSDPNDPEFYTRSGAVINLLNEQLVNAPDERIAASAAYAAARFSIWSTANRAFTKEDLARVRAQAIATFTDGYRQMLEYHFDDYVENFRHHLSAEDRHLHPSAVIACGKPAMRAATTAAAS